MIKIEALTQADAPRCAALERVLFAGDDPWSEAAFLNELAAGHNRYFAARSGDLLVGYGGVAMLGNRIQPESEIHTIGVDPEYQGKGVGARLLGVLLDVAELHGGPVFLEVRTDNEPAITLYRKAGFAIVGTRPRYYQPSGADAYTMCRKGRFADGGGVVGS